VLVVFALVGVQEMLPLVLVGVVVAGVFATLSLISNRNSKAQDRLDRLTRPASLAEIEEPKQKKERLAGVLDAAKAFSKPLMPQTELEQSELKIKLANAGFRSESAVAVYLGLRFCSMMISILLSVVIFLPRYGLTLDGLKPMGLLVGIGFYLPSIILWFLRTKRQEEIFLSLPDALDLMVVCVESGLGLDAAMRKVCDEMKNDRKNKKK
jgi:tight adherence protein C